MDLAGIADSDRRRFFRTVYFTGEEPANDTEAETDGRANGTGTTRAGYSCVGTGESSERTDPVYYPGDKGCYAERRADLFPAL